MSRFKNILIDLYVKHYKMIAAAVALFTLIAGVFLPLVTIDTDPALCGRIK